MYFKLDHNFHFFERQIRKYNLIKNSAKDVINYRIHGNVQKLNMPLYNNWLVQQAMTKQKILSNITLLQMLYRKSLNSNSLVFWEGSLEEWDVSKPDVVYQRNPWQSDRHQM